MGMFQEPTASGGAFKPTPYELGAAFADWDPRTDDVDAPDVPHPLPFCWAIRPWAGNFGRRNHLDLHTGTAWRYKRVFGTVVRIEERMAGSKNTDFLFEVLRRANYRAADTIDKPDLMSRLYFAAMAFSPNFLLADPVPIFLGDRSSERWPPTTADRGERSLIAGNPSSCRIGI